jgi:disulfide bond formation protein DsbB
MSQSRMVMLAIMGSAVLLLAALGFQYLAGMAPCKMCYWQRYPHIAAILFGFGFFIVNHPSVLWMGAASALATAIIGMYHAGVERGIWQGPTSCTSGSIDGLSTEDLMAQIMAAPMVRCDDIAWELFGLSMAGWNAVASLGLVVIWLWASRLWNTR